MRILKPSLRHGSAFETLARAMIIAPLIGFSSSAFAQQETSERTTQIDAATQTTQSKSQELKDVERNIAEALARQKALKEEIARYDRDLGAINRALIQTAKRGQELEAKVSETEASLGKLEATQKTLRQSLSGKRALLGEILGALQRMGTNPPPAILITPEDALSSLRSSILLSAVIPEIKDEADSLFAELAALKETSEAIKQQKTRLSGQLNELAQDESRLTLLVEEKASLAKKSRADLVKQRNKEAALASKALSLKDLIAKLETEIEAAATAARAAREADERRVRDEVERLAKAKKQIGNAQNTSKSAQNTLETASTTRIEPAIAFSKAIAALPQPVSGTRLYGFGDLLDNGRKSRVTALATRTNARVRSPLDGWVVYAGPFRSYGQVLILNAGEGYHMVLSGLSQVNVETGRFVLAGEPVGRMGATRFAATTAPKLGSNKPVLTVELRKGGQSIDPAPWWAKRQKNDNQMSSIEGRQEGSDNDS